jgi:hypothetical protein
MRTGAARLNTSSPALYARLTGRALPLVVLARACGLAVLALLVAGRPKGIRVIAALGVAAVVWGWGVARYPVLLPGTTVTLSNAGAPHHHGRDHRYVHCRRAAPRAVLRPAFHPAEPPPAGRGRAWSADGRRPGRPLRAGGGSPSPAAAAERAPRPAARSATLGMIAIAAIIRRRRRH